MEERGLRNNYFFTLIKFIFFLGFFCLLSQVVKEFWRDVNGDESFKISILYAAIVSTFAFYTFIADLDNFYAKIQRFFFHSSFISFVVPCLLILLGIAYFLLPKTANFYLNRDLYVFLGGFILTAHLIFISRESRDYSFAAFINYLFSFTIICIINIILFGLYLKIAFKVHLGKIIIESLKDSVALVNALIRQIF